MNKLTYLSSNLREGRIIRWPSECFPLPVYIAPCTWYSMNESDRYTYTNMLIDALNMWEKLSSGRISFTEAKSLNDSQMNIEWRRVDRKSLGNCTFSFDKQSRLYSAEVSIGISDGIIHKQYMDENEVFHTILHEIGHALGLGHSNNPGDIMYTPHQYGIINLSQRDINSLKWLYDLPWGASVSALNSKYGVSFDNVDDIIMYLSKNKGGSVTFQNTVKNSAQKSRNLEEEQDKLAQMKKFQISIQHIKLPKEMSDKFKNM